MNTNTLSCAILSSVAKNTALAIFRIADKLNEAAHEIDRLRNELSVAERQLENKTD